jgi:hypothetical protein
MPENSWRFLSRDPSTGAVEHYAYDESEDRCIIRRSWDVAPVIEANKRSQEETGWNKDKSMRLAARIPPDVQLLWLQQYGIRAWDKNHKGAVRRLLNSNEWSHLRYGRHFII